MIHFDIVARLCYYICFHFLDLSQMLNSTLLFDFVFIMFY